MISLSPTLRRNRIAFVIGLACLIATFTGIVFVGAQNDDEKPATPQLATDTKATIAARFAELPLSFERNEGQTDQAVKYLAHGPGYELFLTANEAVISGLKGSVLRLKMLGANGAPQVAGHEELPGKINYFRGNDPEKWRRNIATYRKVHYDDVYPGVDMVYYGNQGELEYDFVVAPGANPNVIKFHIEGADRIRLDDDGNLAINLKQGDVQLHKPLLYQLTAQGERNEIKGEYVIKGNEVSFKVRAFDRAKSLVIDPVLSYSTYLGSGATESALGIAVDAQGSAYVTGTVNDIHFPTTAGAFQTSGSGFGGAFVTKLDPTGSSLVYSTYLSGSSRATGTSIAVDAAGNAYIAGNTLAQDFPLVNPLKTSASLHKTTDSGASWNNNTHTGLQADVRAIAISPTAPNTMYAGALPGVYRSLDGGSTWTKAASTGLGTSPFINAIAVDPTSANIVYAGSLSGGVFKSVNGGDNWTPLDVPLGSAIAAVILFHPVTPSTLYVGAGSGVFRSTDSGNTWTALNNFGLATVPNVRSLAIDPNTPATMYAGTIGNGVFKTVNGGATWTAANVGLGGGDPMSVTSIVIDPFNPTILYTGHFFKNGLPSINKSENGATSWFPLNNGGAQINKLVADRATAGTIYAAAITDGVLKSTNGGATWTQVTNGLWKQNLMELVQHPSNPATLFAGTFGDAADDAFVAKLNASGSGLLFSTYLGGSGGEVASGIAVDSGGNIYVAGQTSSKNFPTVNAVQPVMTTPDSCLGEAFVTKINPAVPAYGFSTYLGGSKCDAAAGVALDPAANVYVTGTTSSTNFPVFNAFQPAAADQFFGEAFVTKLTTTGSFIYSTYLGGNVTDTAFAIAADAAGNAYVTGTTSSSTFPILGAIQGTNNGSQGDVFVTKLNSQGSALVYSTFLGGSNADVGRGIAVDAAGNAYVTGFTRSVEFPVVAGALRTRSAIFKSVNGATSWSNDNYGLRAGTVYNVVVHPMQPSTIYVATSNGVFKSTNGGRTWLAMNTGLTSQHVIALVIDPLTPATLYAATNEPGSIHNGVYKSTDNAVNWIPHRTGMVNTQLSSLAIDPVTPNTLYAGTFGGPIYKTTDGANNWAPSGAATPGFAISLAVDKFAPATIYAADSSSGGGIRKSVDGGATWQLLPMDQAPGGFSVSLSPHTAGVVYAGTSLGLFKSTNGGSSWTFVRSGFGRVVFDPSSSSTVYLLSGSEGVLKSTNNGQTWTAMNKGLQLPVALAMAVDPFQPSILHLLSSPAGGEDAFVSKINASGKALVYSTFVGGNTGEQFGASAQAFAIALDSGGNAYITGLARPNFTTTPGAYQTVSRGFDDAFISKLSTSYSISGHVINFTQPVFGAEVVLNDGVSLTSVMTESDGGYEFSRLREGGNYTVTARKPQLIITPASHTFNNLNSDQILDFSSLQSDSPFYFINGQITNNGVPLPGVTVTLSGSQSGLRTTDSNGDYSFQLIVAGNYTVTPSLFGFTFGPASQTFNPLSSDQTANFAATRQDFVVTNANNDGPGSLRDAIINANATVGTDKIVFNIPGPGVKSIKVQNALPEIVEQVTIDATTQPGYAGAPLVELDGTQAGDINGIVIKASGSTLRGLAIGGFRGFGVVLSNSDNNTIQANYIGIDATGTQERQNHYGILIATSSNNLIGGTTAAARNVISGNTFYGLEVGGTGNVIQGNFIGTNATGTAAIGNHQAGIDISSSQYTGNLIGGDTPGAGNLISGNSRGISISAPSNTIQGNLIGTDVTGTSKIENSVGIRVEGVNNLVGGLTPGARNVISGNFGDGVIISGAGSKLQGNYIGTDITGTLALGNGGGVLASVGALIGGTAAGARNVIAASGMQTRNVEVGTNGPSSGVTVQGNYIGTDVTGTRALGDTIIGIRVTGVGHTIGGAVAGAGNVISGHGFGIYLVGDGFVPGQGNTVQGNLIGLNASGTGPLPNAIRGIEVAGASNTVIGGTQPGAANRIAFNGGSGVNVPLGFNNSVRGNSIFSNDGLGIDLGFQGVTPNDLGDIDTGGNNLQNFPVLTSVTSGGGSTTIQGTLNSKPNTTFEIDFYSSAALDPSGNGEGAQFFNTTSIVTNSNGTGTINVTFPVALGAGRVITATATDPAGNTSEFSSGDATNAAGSVQFSAPAMWFIEDVGVAAINVVRHGGSAGSLSVDYASADGVALAGEDYTAVSGTLNFANGETSKTILVPIANDSTTEAEEGFTISLRNPSTLEALGAPAILRVFIQDRTTTPFIFIRDNSIVEGAAGTTTTATFTVNLSAATGRTISVNYATGNGNAIGGASCSNAGTDYESTSGSLTFQPGTSSLPISVKICGDANAEANEFFVIGLTNATNATVGTPQAFITIMNDELLGLVLEDPSPNVNQAAAIDALLFVRDPFRIVTVPEMFANGSDRNTRVAFFATGLQLDPGETASSVIVRIVGSNSQTHDVPAENVLPVPNTEFTQVIVRLPDDLTPGTATVTLRAHGRSSNIGTIRIAP